MKMKLRDVIELIIVGLGLSLLLLRCDKIEDTTQADDQLNRLATSPKGQLVSKSNCKNNLKNANFNISQSCIEYSMNSAGELIIKHINTAFNCCLDSVKTDFIFDGNNIIIGENEYGKLCKCNCLYDLEYKITGLKKETYKISVKEPLVTNNDKTIDFEIDLTQKLSGSFCVTREHYPWSSAPACTSIDTSLINSSKLFSFEDFPNDMLKINSVNVNGNCVDINVSYSGGCKTHDFKLIRLYTVSRHPCALYLSHKSNSDLCEAYLTETISFDLKSLRESGKKSTEFALMAKDYYQTFTYTY